MPRKKDKWLNEFTVLGVFIAVSLGGLLFGGFMAVFDSIEPAKLLVPVIAPAPTEAEYQQEVRRVMRGFMSQYWLLTEDDFDSVSEPLRNLVGVTQDRLIGVRVPASERDTHLSLVLLMDQWKRALNSSAANYHSVLLNTDAFLELHPWLSIVGI